jgi:hypothetical protein
MDNPDTLATLGARQKTKTNKTKTQQDEQHGPHQKSE